MMSKTKYSISKRKSLSAPTFQGCPWLTWDVQSVQDSKKLHGTASLWGWYRNFESNG